MLWFTVAGGTDLGSTLPADRAFSLGGPQSFPGYARVRSAHGRYWTVDGAFLWNVADILPILSQTLYGGITLEGGRVYERVDPVPDGSVYGVSVFSAGRTPIGTLTLGDGWAIGREPAGSRWAPRSGTGNDPRPSDVPLRVQSSRPTPRGRATRVYGCASDARIRCEKSSALSAACARSLTWPRRCQLLERHTGIELAVFVEVLGNVAAHQDLPGIAAGVRG